MTPPGKSLLKIFTGIVLILLLVFGSVAGYFLLNKEKVIRAVVQQLNQKLQVPVEVNTIDVSLRHFPQLSIVFTDVKCKEATVEASDYLFAAKRVYFNFSLTDVLFSRYYINEIQLEKGEITIKFFENGTHNFQIFKEDSSTDETPFNIDKLSVKDIVFRYSDFREKIFLTQTIHQALIHSKFGKKNLHTGSWIATNISFKFEDFHLEEEIQHKADFDISIDKENTLLALKNSSIDGISYTLNYTANNTNKEVKFSVPEQKFFSSNIVRTLVYRITSDFQLKNDKTTVNILGKSNGEKWKFSGDFSTAIKHFNYRNGKYNAEQILCDGNFDFENKEKYTVALKSLSVKQGAATCTGNVYTSKEKNKTLYGGNLSLSTTPSDLAVLAGISHLTGSGILKADLEFKHQIKASATKDKARIIPEKFSCTLVSDNLTLNYGFNNIFLPSIHWHISDERMVLKQHSEINGRKLYADLLVSGFTNWLLKDEMLSAEGSVFIDHYDENFWKSDLKEPNTPGPLSLIQSLKLKLDLEIGKYIADQLVCEQIKVSVVKYTEDYINIENLQMNVLGGSVIFKGRLATQNSTALPILLNGTAELNKIDLSRLLQSFNDFDQHELTHKNLYGKLSGTIQFSIPIDGKFDPDFRKINAQSNVRVTNGRLYNFAPIEALSRFADIEELKDIRFEELTNKLVIENQMIHIPQFSVRSNALDLILEGTHTFDNEVDYKVGLNLSDIVYQKRKRKTSINELIFEEDRDGAKLWIRISGNITSPKITPIKAELISQKTTIFRNSKAQSQDSIPGKKPIRTPYRFEWDEQ